MKRERYQKIKATGFCPRCYRARSGFGVKVVPGKAFCQDCLDEYAKGMRELIGKRLCVNCRKPIGEDGTKIRCSACGEQKAASDKAKLERIKDEVYAAYGGYVCDCCGETNRKFLSIDHINSDGAEHRKTVKGNIVFILHRLKFPKGYRVLCFNCNIGRAKNCGICPHFVF